MINTDLLGLIKYRQQQYTLDIHGTVNLGTLKALDIKVVSTNANTYPKVSMDYNNNVYVTVVDSSGNPLGAVDVVLDIYYIV